MSAEPVVDGLLGAVCRAAGLDPRSARPLRAHATSVYLLPDHQAVLRISSAETDPAAVRRALAVTTWLGSVGFPTVTPTAGFDQPIEVDGRQATFWHHVPDPPAGATPGPAELGALLRRLHDLPAPPVDLPQYRPLRQFREVVEPSTALDPGDRAWLLERADQLLASYAELGSRLGHGHIHGDAYPGNMIGSADAPVLADWEETGQGPRELDLANTFQGVRFGRSVRDLDAFADAYGHDPRGWAGLTTLTAIRDLHTLGSYVRRSEGGDLRARAELAQRLASLRRGDADARWTAA